jgi:uncharacterized protein with GYD domain
MTSYLYRVSLSAEGIAGVLKEGAGARKQVVTDAIESLGGTVEAFYFAFGDDDVVVIAQMPDNETAAGFALETSASGRVSVSTTVLLTPDDVDRAREKKSGWRAPGA